MKRYSFIVLVILSLSACKPEKAKITLPKSENKLVVSCFISPEDSLITATVRLSTPKFGTFGQRAGTADDIQNANVVISDGARSVALVFDNSYFFYKATSKQLPIISGKTYYLKVSTPDGKEVTATTTVPVGKLDVKSLEIRKTKDTPSALNFEISLTVNDIENQTNYVGIGFQTPTAFKTATFNLVDTTDYGGVTLSFFDDDEKTVKTNYFTTYSGFNEFSGIDTIAYAFANAAVLNCSKDFYLYNRSASLAEFSGGNPFSDPVLIYSNITNGFGCFGSYVGNYLYRRIR